MKRILIAALLLPTVLLAEEGEDKALERATKVLARKDANGDGRLSAEELGVEAYIFRVLDRNGDGFVTAEEIKVRQPPRARGEKQRPGPGGGRPDFAARFMERHDKDGDAKLSKQEFPQGGRISFDKADANADGFVDKDELGKLFSGRGPRAQRPGDKAKPRGLDPRQVREMAGKIMQQHDKNGDGKLGADELPEAGKATDRKGRIDFSKADRNGDGFVDTFELTIAITDARGGLRGKTDRARDRQPNPKMFVKMIQKMDADKDGVVTKEEWKGRPQAFARLDTNKDNQITKEELAAAAKQMQRWRGRAGEALFRRMDADKDGRISAEEWKLDQAYFKKFDRNGDGFISPDEVTLFRKQRRGRGPDARSGKSSAHFLEKYDRNRDGQVGKDEFPHERRFAEMDANGDGTLSKAEIEEAMDKRMRESRYGFFERFDLNGDGKVTREEFTGPAADFEAKDTNNDGVIDASDRPDEMK